MSGPMKDREFRCTLGDLVEALYDEVVELPLSNPAKQSLVAIMLGDIMRREGRAIYFQARHPWRVILDVA